VVVRPILVERTLRASFDNDDKLHGSQRQRAENIRDELLAAKRNGASADRLLSLLKERGSNQVSETTWQLGASPVQSQYADQLDELAIRKQFGPSVQTLSPPRDERETKLHFEDLTRPLKNMLRSQ